MASAAVVRRKLASLKGQARRVSKNLTLGRAAPTERRIEPTPGPPTRALPELPKPSAPDPTRTFVSFAGEQRLQQLAAVQPSREDESPPTFAPSAPPALRVERAFTKAQAPMPERPPGAHWFWSSAAFIALVGLATNAALALPADASEAQGWRTFAVWSFFVVSAAMVLVLSWRNLGFPTILSMFFLLLLAWRAPFLAMGIFSDQADWMTVAAPWWSLFTITLLTKALETRGTRRRYHVRALMVLQGMQIATYAGLVLLSIFFLGRNGAIGAEWALTIVALLLAWFVQGRSVLIMWNRNVGAEPQKAANAPIWTTSAEHTGK